MTRALFVSVVVLSACSGQIAPLDDAGPVSGADAGVQVDAGAGDAGATDAGVAALDAGPVACPSTAALCESFEDGLDLTRWSINGDAATFVIDGTTPSPSGQKSLHVMYGLPRGHAGQQSIELKGRVAAPDDRMYLRTYMRFGDLSLPGPHPFFIDVSDSTGRELGFGSIINDFAFMAYAPQGLDDSRTWYEGDGFWHPGVENGDATPNTENTLTAQTWVCVELMYFGDHQAPGDTQHPGEEVKVWLNGTEIPQMSVTDAIWASDLGHAPPEHWSPVYSEATWRFGVESFGPENVNLDLWFDGIVFSTQRVGCL